MAETKRLTKKEREELLKLKEIVDNVPNAKKVLEALVENQNSELNDVVRKTIQPHLEKARMMGVQIGWNGALITLEGQCRQCWMNLKDLSKRHRILRSAASTIR